MEYHNNAGRWLAISILAGVIALVAQSGNSDVTQARGGSRAPDIFAPAPVYSTAASIRFAVVGDYGFAGANELAVSTMISNWTPDFIITVGDNNYDSGLTATLDANIGQYYSNYIYPYTGTFTPSVAITQNLFFPSLGNHDWGTPGATPYLNYFSLPGNERYYDFVWGPAHFFALDSDPNEPDGYTLNSAQATWLNTKLATAHNTWNIVYFHHAPYSSSSSHGSNTNLQWPFQAWGASTVIAGHDHTYERIIKNNFPYFVNGLGGRSRYDFGTPVAGSAFQFRDNYGAMLVTADDSQIVFKFHSITDTVNALDTYTLTTKPSINRAYMPLIKR